MNTGDMGERCVWGFMWGDMRSRSHVGTCVCVCACGGMLRPIPPLRLTRVMNKGESSMIGKV